MEPEKLAAEMETFRSHRDELLGRAQGKYVLIKNARVMDVFESHADALHRGYQEFGTEPFLVKQIVDVEVPQNFASFQVGA